MSVSHRVGLLALGLLAANGLVAGPAVVWAQELPQTDDLGATEISMGRTPFALQGFGDVNYTADPPGEEQGGFSNGALDLFATSRLGDHWSALAELVFEADGNTLATDLERFQFTYEHSDAFRISAGRVHNPFLRWPITNHHGLFHQTTIDRPIIARWEDEPGLWPMHFVGLLSQGRLRGRAGLSYALGVGNGRGRVLDEVQVGSDANRQKAVVASLGLNPDAVPGLALYVAAYFDRIPAVSGSLREQDYTGSAAYVRGNVELRGEWSRLGHESVDSGIKYKTTGWYALAAYRLSGLGGVKPCLLIESLNVADDEAFLEGAQDEEAWALGLRWDANRWVALKGDYRSRRLEGGDREGAIRFQLAVNF